MASRETTVRARNRELDREIDRYREAAETALDQLEWTIDYLGRIHKGQIARALDRNRKQIMETMPHLSRRLRGSCR